MLCHADLCSLKERLTLLEINMGSVWPPSILIRFLSIQIISQVNAVNRVNSLAFFPCIPKTISSLTIILTHYDMGLPLNLWMRRGTGDKAQTCSTIGHSINKCSKVSNCSLHKKHSLSEMENLWFRTPFTGSILRASFHNKSFSLLWILEFHNANYSLLVRGPEKSNWCFQSIKYADLTENDLAELVAQIKLSSLGIIGRWICKL